VKAAAQILPDFLPRYRQRLAGLFHHGWFQELGLRSPAAAKKRATRKAEDCSVFGASGISHIAQLSIYVTDVGWSRAWYEDAVGLRHSRTVELQPHPLKPGWQIRCCYMSAADHDECLVLIEEYDPAGRITVPSEMCLFQFAVAEDDDEVDQNQFAEPRRTHGHGLDDGPSHLKGGPPPGGGEKAGNSNCLYDPDWNGVDFCEAMETVPNDPEPCADETDHLPE
jgi:hypothetical protein